MITRSWAAAELADVAATLPSATLAEVTGLASLQERVERRYMVPVNRVAELVDRLATRYVALDIDGLRSFAYQSVYFDTPDLLTYRQHLQGRRRRFKVRTRAYLDSADCMFEVKFKGLRDQTVKAQLPYVLADRTRITARAQAFLVDLLNSAYGQPAPLLARRVTTSYRRTTLVDLERSVRVTCDVDFTCTGGGRRAVGPPLFVLVETKGITAHNDADVALRSLGLHPVQMSKYCIAVALLYPSVRSNRWHRTLHRYFAGTSDERAP